MAAPIINSPVPSHLIEYNTYKFGPKCHTSVQITANKDSSNRSVISRTYLITVSGMITPRRLIPGDDFGIGIQLPAPQPLVPKPGFYPWHQNATVDSEMNIIRCKLEESGKTFRYCGQGLNDIYVNTINPNTGKFVPDLNYGPHVRLLSLHPSGFNKAWKIEWQIEFTLPECCTQSVDIKKLDYNDPKNRILEYNYDVQYSIDREGYTKRTIRGHLTIIPPVFRYPEQLPVLGLKGQLNPDKYPNLLDSLRETQNNIIDINTDVIEKEGLVSLNISKLVKVINGLSLSDKQTTLLIIRNLLTGNRSTYSDANHIFSAMSDNWTTITGNPINGVQLGNLVSIAGILSPIISYIPTNNLTKIIDSNTNKVYDLNNFFNILNNNYDQAVARQPYTQNIYPAAKTRNQIAPKDAFGPYIEDNIGNIQNYETVDQYRDLITNSIDCPLGFARVSQQFHISEDKRRITFTIMDEQQPGFSQVPGYSKVTFSHNLRTHGIGQIQWHSTLRGKFIFPNFVNQDTDPNLVGLDAGYSSGRAIGTDNLGAVNKNKVYPDKIKAYLDFMKVFYQRYALILLGNHETEVTFTNKDGVKRNVNTGAMRIIDFSMSEDMTGNEIDFSISVLLTTEMRDIFQVTGSGLPLIIASDLDTDANINKAALALNKEQNAAQIAGFAQFVQFSTYYDRFKAIDWQSSQLFAGLNSRGSAGLIFDRTYDRPFDVCHDPATKIEHLIPKHQAPNMIKGDLDKVNRKKLRSESKKIKFILQQNKPGPRTLNPNDPTDVDIAKQIIGPDAVKKIVGDFLINFNQREQFCNAAQIIIDAQAEKGIDILKNLGIGGFNPGVQSEFDVYLAENLGLISTSGVDVTDPTNFNDPDINTLSMGTFSSVSFTNASDTTAPEQTFQRSVEDLVFDKLQLLIGVPAPNRSWLTYSCALEVDTTNGVVRHKLLPKSYAGPLQTFNVSPTTTTLLEDNFGPYYNSGPDMLVGEGRQSISTLQFPPADDIIQFVRSPKNVLILRGNALRTGYPVVPPTLLKYGTQNVYQVRRRFNSGMVDKSNGVIWFGEWEITYITANTPSGRLLYPDHPFVTTSEDYNPPQIKDYTPITAQLNTTNTASSQITTISPPPPDLLTDTLEFFTLGES